MSKIAFFGAGNGLAKSLSTVAQKAGFQGSITATDNVSEFAQLAKTAGHALGGPATFNNSEICSALGLHTRVIRSFGPANIPKPRDLYRGVSYSVIMPASEGYSSTNDAHLSIAEAANISSHKIHRDALKDHVEPLAKYAADLIKHSASQVTFASLDSEDSVSQQAYLAAIKDILPEDFHIKQIALPNLINEAIMAPQNLGAVVLAPNFATPDAVNAIVGLLGGDGIVPMSWVGDDVTIHHTGARVEDSERANFYSAALALCELLAHQHAGTADKLYAGLRKAAAAGCTYEAARAGKLVERVAAAI